MHAENRLVRYRAIFNHVADEFRVIAWNRIAHGIGQIDDGRPGIDCCCGGFHQKILVGAGGVFG